MKYLDNECEGCDYWDSLHGCFEQDCSIYKEYQEGRAEMEADNDHDRRKDNRIHPIFDGIMKNIQGDF